MDFAFSAEQEQWRAQNRNFLADRYPDPAAGAGETVWPELAALGWFDPDLPMVERALVAEECGYALCPDAWITRLSLTDELAIAVGPVPTALIGAGDEASSALGGFVVRESPDGWCVSGEAARVLDAPVAQALLVATADGVYLVDAGAAGCAIRPVAGIDLLRSAGSVTCDGVPARRLLPAAVGARAIAAVRLRLRALLAAEAVGVAQRCYDVAVAHAKARQQFGRPIGAYQGVAFAIADCYVRTELARTLAYRAGWLIGAGAPEAETAVATAVAATRRAAVANAERAIQTLGGLGMTWEHPLHHWYRRAMWFDGYGRSTRDTLADLADVLLPR